jgi:hypothetical protein
VKIEPKDRPVVLALLAVALSLVLNWSFPVRHPQHKADNHADQAFRDDVTPWKTAGFWEALATSLIAIYAMRQYAESRHSSERQLRAYVNIKEGGSAVNQADITVENFGQTPAYNVTHWADAVHVDQGQVPAFVRPAGALWSPGMPAAPTAQFRIRPVVRDLRVKLNPILHGRQSRIFAWGEITYTDAFKEERTTQFCFFVDFPFGAFRPFEGGINRAT